MADNDIIIMTPLRFEWDKEKELKNQKKHGVDFSEALSVFYDDNALYLVDPLHSTNEERFIILGLSTTRKLLVVVHCYRCEDEIVRIISARKATKTEQKQYFRS